MKRKLNARTITLLSLIGALICALMALFSFTNLFDSKNTNNNTASAATAGEFPYWTSGGTISSGTQNHPLGSLNNTKIAVSKENLPTYLYYSCVSAGASHTITSSSTYVTVNSASSSVTLSKSIPVGTYTITITPTQSGGTGWANMPSQYSSYKFMSVYLTIQVDASQTPIPTTTQNVLYSTSSQNITLSSTYNASFTLPTGWTRSDKTVTIPASAAVGDYAITASLVDTSKPWADGSTGVKTLTVKIRKAMDVSFSYGTVTYGTASGKPTVTGNTSGGTVTWTTFGGGDNFGSIDSSTGVITPKKAGRMLVSMSIAAKGDYAAASKVDYVDINAKSISASGITVSSIADQAYTGSALTPAPTIKDGTITLVKDTDYTLSYSSNTNIGTATITIEGSGNYTGTRTTTFKIYSTMTKPSAAKTSFTYNGSAQTLISNFDTNKMTATVKAGSGTASSTTSMSQTNANTYTYSFTPKTNYKWSDGTTAAVTVTVTIAKYNLSSSTVTLGTTSYTYDGTEKKPSVSSVKMGSTTIASSNYTVSYSDNKAASTTAKVTVTATEGNANFTGSKTVNFTINSATMAKPSAAATSFTYNGSAQTLISNFDTNKMTATVKVGSGTASSTTSMSQTNANTYTYSFTPKTNYKWSDNTSTAVTVTVTIAKYNLSNSTVTLGTTSYTYDGTAKKPSVSSVKMGSTTVAISNYTVTYSDNTAASTTAKVTVTATEGNANFTGSKTVNFTINSATMTKPSKAADSFTYNGSAQTLISNFDTNKMTATVQAGSGTATTTTSMSQTNAGTYTFKFTPKTNYKWSDNTSTAVTVTVTIAKYDLKNATVTLGTTSYTYDGTEKKPSVSSVKMGSTTIASSNYAVTYSDNKAASTTAKVTVTATTSSTNFTGSQTVNFTISSATMTKPSKAADSFMYNFNAQSLIKNFDSDKMTATVKVGSGTATATTSVSQTNANTYTYSFTPKTNYKWSDNTTGAVTVTVTIDKFDLKNADVTLSDWSYTYDGTAKEPTVTVRDRPADSKFVPSNIIASSNYTVTYSNNTAASENAEVTVTATNGNANFTGSQTVKFTINSATLTKPSAAATSFTYNGSAQTLIKNFDSDKMTAMVKVGSGTATATMFMDQTDANTYTFAFTPKTNYKWSDDTTDAVTVTVTISKANYDMTGAGWDYTSAFTYDGSAKTVGVTGLPTGVTVASYTDNTATVAGDYTASVTLSYDSDNYNAPSIDDLSWTISKADFDISGITFDDLEAEYDGNKHTVVFEGSLPAGLSFTGYTITDSEGNVKNVNYATNAGVYTVAIVLNNTKSDNYNTPEITATLTIKQATATATVTLPTGDEIYYYLGDDLPDFDGLTTSSVPGTFSWDGDGKITDANGSYGWTFTPDDSDNYEEVTGSVEVAAVPKLVSLSVTGATTNYKALDTFDTSVITVMASYQTGKGDTVVRDYTVIYHTEKDHFVLADNGENLVISYTENGQTATAEITITIDVKEYDLSGVSLDDLTVTYDGETYSITYSGELPEGLSITGYTYNGVESTGESGAGTYEVKAVFELDDPDNYKMPELSATLTINKATPTVEGVELVSGKYYKGAELSTVHLTYDESNTSPEGTLAWADGSAKLGSAEDGSYKWVFTPNDTANYDTAEGWIQIDNLQEKIEGIEVIDPTTEYSAYESFATEGVKVLVTYLDETTKEVDIAECTLVYPDSEREYFLIGDDKITVWYGNVSTTVSVTVSKESVDTSDITFDDKLDEVYDGSSKSVIAENLPDGIEVDYYTYAGERVDGKTDVGTYEVKVYFKVTDDPDNVEVPEPMTATLKISQAKPEITVEVDYGRYPKGATLSDVKLKYDCELEGTLSWTVGGIVIEDDGEYEWTFKPTDTKNYKTVKGTLTVEIFYEVSSIQVTVNKTEYEAYDKLEEADITVKAIFVDKAPANVDGWTATYPNGGDCFLVDDSGKDVIISYNDAQFIIQVTVNKKTVDMSGVNFDDKLNETYDGNTKFIVPENLPDGVEVDYYLYNTETLNGVTDAGDYAVTVYFKVTDENLTIETDSKTANLHVEKADTELTFNGATEFTYTGETVTIESGASVDNTEQTTFTYTDNTFLNVSDSGVMTVTVAASKNYKGTSIEVNITVNPAVLTLTWTGGNATYDGYSHSASLTVVSGAVENDKDVITTENLAELITVSYTGDDPDRKQKGDYTVTLVSFPESGIYANYTYTVTNDPYTFTISDSALNVTFNGDTVVYDGEVHMLSVDGLPAPEEMTVTYYCDGEVFTGATDKGTYEVEARFECLTTNFTAPEPMKAILVIDAKDIAGAQIDGVDEEHIYDGKIYKPEDVTVTLDGKELEEGVDFEITYTGSGANAGSTGKVIITGKGNYGGSVEIEYVIVIRELELEWDKDDYYYNGAPQGVTAHLTNVVDGEEVNIEITYTGTGYSDTVMPTNAGTYTATVTLDSPYANYTLTEQSETFEIKRADVEVTLNYGESFDSNNLYDGMQMPEVTVVATSDGKEVEGKFTWANTSLVWGTETYGWTFVPDDSNYNVKQDTENFTVKEAKITKLTVTWIDDVQPEIFISTKLDTIRNSLVVTGTLQNEQTIVIAGYALTCDAFSNDVPSRPGTYTLKVKFNGKDATIAVQYEDVVCNGVVIEPADGKETKTDYFAFDKFDTSTIKVTATFNDGSERVLTDADYTIVYANDGETMLVGDKYVKVNFNGTEKPIYVNVAKKPYDTSGWNFADKTSTYDGNGKDYKIEGAGEDFYVGYEYYKKNADGAWTKLASKDEVKNAGEYKIVATIRPVGNISDNYTYPETLESMLTVTKLTPDIGKPGVGGNLSVGTKLSELSLSVELDGITGTFVWDNEEQVLKEGINICRYTFIPDDDNYNIVRGSIELPAGGTASPDDGVVPDGVDGSGLSTGIIAAIIAVLAISVLISACALIVAFRKKANGSRNDSDGFYDDATSDQLME